MMKHNSFSILLTGLLISLSMSSVSSIAQATSPAICKMAVTVVRDSESELGAHLREGRVDVATIKQWTKMATASGLIGGKLQLAMTLLYLSKDTNNYNLKYAMIRRYEAGERKLHRQVLTDKYRVLYSQRNADIVTQNAFYTGTANLIRDTLTGKAETPFLAGKKTMLPRSLEVSLDDMNSATELFRQLERHPAGLAFLREALAQTTPSTIKFIRRAMVDADEWWWQKFGTFGVASAALGAFIGFDSLGGYDPYGVVEGVIAVGGIATGWTQNVYSYETNLYKYRPGSLINFSFHEFAQKFRAARTLKQIKALDKELVAEQTAATPAKEKDGQQAEIKIDSVSIARINATLSPAPSFAESMDFADRLLGPSVAVFDQVASFFEKTGEIRDQTRSFVEEAIKSSDTLTAQQARVRAQSIGPKIRDLLIEADKSSKLLEPLERKIDEFAANVERSLSQPGLDPTVGDQLRSSLQSLRTMQTTVHATSTRMAEVRSALAQNNEALRNVQIALSVKRLSTVTSTEEFKTLLQSSEKISLLLVTTKETE
jgi:hypothetical protein